MRRRWARWWWSSSTAALGCTRERGLEEGARAESNGERQRVVQGGDEGRIGAPRWKQEVEARARARRHASASRQRLKTAVPLVGWAAKWTGQVFQVSTLSLCFLFVPSFLIFAVCFWFSFNTKSILNFMKIIVWTKWTYPKPRNNFSELLNIYLLYNKFRSNSNIYWINSNGQNKCLWAPKNIGLNFTSCQYFYRIPGTFSWTHLRRF